MPYILSLLQVALMIYKQIEQQHPHPDGKTYYSGNLTGVKVAPLILG